MLKEKRCVLLFPGRSKKKKNEHIPESDTIAYLRVKLHCPACVSEVTRSLQRLNGVVEVTVDPKAGLIRVKGIQLEAQRLCEGVLKKTGKRCEVLLVSSIEEHLRNSAASNQQPMQEVSTPNIEEAPAGATVITPAEGAPADDQAVKHQLDLQQQDQSSSADVSHNFHDISEPRMEIKHQTHTVIYGRPSHFTTPPLNYWSPAQLDYSYVHEYPPDFRYQELLSEENPNACQVM